MWLLTKSKNRVSARKQIKIREVTDNILVLPNHEYREILETSSINFELKSEAEQDVIIDSFQNFLNALPCPIQILVRVREIDIDQYVNELERLKSTEKEPIYKNQIDNYTGFIKSLVSGNKILSRRFYIVIPFTDLTKKDDMSLVKEHLNLNRDIITRGLERLGMKARLLESLEILELFYGFYNPNQDKTQELRGKTVEALIGHNYV
jgi:hypothetical protein